MVEIYYLHLILGKSLVTSEINAIFIKSIMQSNSELLAVDNGKQHEEILYSLKKIGLAGIILCICLFCTGILTTIVGTLYLRWWHVFTKVTSGVWCGLLSFPAAIMSLVTANKTSCFNMDGHLFFLFIFSVSIIGAFFLLIHLCVCPWRLLLKQFVSFLTR